MKKEVAGMFNHVDTGEELDLSGIPDERIRMWLERFFKAMLFEEGKEGGWKRSANTPKLLPMFGPAIQRYEWKASNVPEKPPPPPSETKDMEAPPARPKRAGPAMPSMEMIERAKKMAEEKAWEKEGNEKEGSDGDGPEDDDDLGPTLPGQAGVVKERAMAELRRVRAQALEAKRLGELKPKHEGWMTAIPAAGKISAKSDERGRTFSMKGVKSRGDTSEWTMTPEERRRIQAEKMLEMHAPGDKRKRGKLKIKGREEKKLEGAVTSGESLLSMHQKKRKKNQRKQVGGTFGFSFSAMREDRQFNKKEADKMGNSGKQLAMGFSSGTLYKSQI